MKITVCGAGGFIGDHLVRSLIAEGHEVLGVDLKLPEFRESEATRFIIGDLRDPRIADQAVLGADHVYQLAADMGGAGYLFTGEHDADILHNSCLINLNILKSAVKHRMPSVLYTSSACVYPTHVQASAQAIKLREDSVYPASPDHDYGFEKLFSERAYQAFARNYGLRVRIARLHNVFGPYGAWDSGREKAPAAICRKVAAARPHGAIEVWGDGEQQRSFLYIDECVEGLKRLTASECELPVNLGSERAVSINDLVALVSELANKPVQVKHVDGPLGVRGRASDNAFIQDMLGWKPRENLEDGLKVTYEWIDRQLCIK